MSCAISVKAFDGREVFLLDEDWLHIRFRHPEVGFETELLSRALIQPDEAYRNGRGGVHALMRIDETTSSWLYMSRPTMKASYEQPI